MGIGVVLLGGALLKLTKAFSCYKPICNQCEIDERIAKAEAPRKKIIKERNDLLKSYGQCKAKRKTAGAEFDLERQGVVNKFIQEKRKSHIRCQRKISKLKAKIRKLKE